MEFDGFFCCSPVFGFLFSAGFVVIGAGFSAFDLFFAELAMAFWRSNQFRSDHGCSSFNTFTVYVDNLPFDMDVVWLRQIFKGYGPVLDAFIPLKRSSRESILNLASSDLVLKRKRLMRCSGLMVGLKGLIKEVLAKENGSKWLETSAVGELLVCRDTKELQDLFISHGIWDAHIRYMGVLYVLLSFDSKESLDSFLEDNKVCLSQWFASVEAWIKHRMMPSRCTWLSCFRVPLNVWNTHTFSNISKIWGETVKIDELTAKSLAFDKGRIFILTEQLECINEVVNLNVKGVLYPIKVVEDPVAETTRERRVVSIMKVKNGISAKNGLTYEEMLALCTFLVITNTIVFGCCGQKSVLGLIRLAPSKKRKIQILKDVSGIVKPSRMTLLLGPPNAGKTTLLLALAGKLDRDLRLSGKVTYCGHELNEFVPQRTCAYISQLDLHYGGMTVRETLDLSGRCFGVGKRYEMLVELSRREKEAGIKPDPEIDAFMKATAVSGQESSLATDYIIKILGLDICADILVGDEMRRGISGGQKKRVTTGMISKTVKRKHILFLLITAFSPCFFQLRMFSFPCQ
ncbi:hypothetical protein RHGRI_005615 [Rhododendron griersonianum]|uniref:Uncharacterized protein n=1 Tax=Rhododendron griersonianum TaxID=479676 RepID=A0AAV6LDU3_9ERIC|nr:hypothetical protein RHGRI_005615 [Rhododendron griersonianum]